MAIRRTYRTTAMRGDDGRLYVPVPFDPNEVWGTKSRHSVAGTVAGVRVRGDVRPQGDGHAFILGPAWQRHRALAPGDRVEVTIEAEGPQRADLADDVAEALEAEPKAGEAFDSLAQFYRKAFLVWIESTKRRPEERPIRIAEMVALLRAGKKQRP